MFETKSEYPISAYWETVYDKSLAGDKTSGKTHWHEMPSVEQISDYSCGPSIIASVANKINGTNLTELDLITAAEERLAAIGTSLKESGTPPEVMLQLLKDFAIHTEGVFEDETHTDETVNTAALHRLEDFIRSGCVCIVAMQTSPDFLLTNLHTAEQVPQSYTKEDERGVDYSLSFDEHYNLRTTSNDPYWNGHYSMIIGELVGDDGREYFIMQDSSTHNLQKEQITEGHEMDPKYYGVALIEKKNFIRNWYDTSIDKTINYDHWVIPIKVEE